MKSEFIFEIYSEEMPAKSVSLGCLILTESFKECGFENTKVYATPVRFCIFIDNLPLKIIQPSQKIKGPKADVSLDIKEKFASKNKIKASDLTIEDGFYFYNKPKTEIDTADVLRNTCLFVLEKLGKSWSTGAKVNDSAAYWVRPIRNLMCILNGNVVDFEFSSLKTNNLTFGHKLLGKKPQSISTFTQYKQYLESEHITLDQNARKNLIKQHIDARGEECNNLEILDEVVNLCEHINPLEIKIEQRFLSLPAGILISTISKNQKYFTFSTKAGDLSENVLVISNLPNRDLDVLENVKKGNLKVLNARLNDADYFYQIDLKTPLINNLEKLKSIAFHVKLGSLYDRTQRMIKIALKIGESFPNISKTDLENACKLSKCDIPTQVVTEFTELQGYMASQYAKIEGYPNQVCDALEDQYLPLGEAGDMPRSDLACIIALSEKLEKIIGLWLAGEKPTSSKDPFAIRRDTLGILRILQTTSTNINLKNLLDTAFLQDLFNLKINYEPIVNEIIEFFKERLKINLAKQYDSRAVDALIGSSRFFEDLNIISVKIQHVSALNQDFLQLAKRVFNILKGQEVYLTEPAFDTPETQALHDQYTKVQQAFFEIQSLQNQNPQDKINLLNTFEKPLANFFEKVMVMCEDKNLRNQRLYLLLRIRDLFFEVADFSKL